MAAAVDSKVKPTKNSLRRAKKKEKRNTGAATNGTNTHDPPSTTNDATVENDTIPTGGPVQIPPTTIEDEQIEIDDFDLPDNDPLYSQFQEIAARFIKTADKRSGVDDEEDEQQVFHNDEQDGIPDEEEEEAGLQDLAVKPKKQKYKLTIAELKAMAKDPMLVEESDRTAPDPVLLISIKAQRNIVPVPAHWSVKREYLSSKRGIEKSAFVLPKFIADTGIQEMREAVIEKEGESSLKQKQRERVQPKMGKLDIDYQKLRHAFFRHQTKPVLTRYGEVYFEGKENESNAKNMRPGDLSDDLREALSMGPGAPPPWLIQQQRFGPPPGYPGLLIPGLNAPIPPGTSWGFEVGQYGKPPTDAYGTPLYGGYLDGTLAQQSKAQAVEPADKTLWGEILPAVEDDDEEEEEEESEDEEGSDDGIATARTGLATPSGKATASGMASTRPVAGTQTVQKEFQLRKGEEASRSAYQVLPEQNIRTAGFFGGEKAYDLGSARETLGDESSNRKRKAGDVQVSVDVDALNGQEMSKEDMKRQYEAASRAQADAQWKGNGGDHEDFSRMIDEESNKRLKKDRENNERRRQGRH